MKQMLNPNSQPLTNPNWLLRELYAENYKVGSLLPQIPKELGHWKMWIKTEFSDLQISSNHKPIFDLLLKVSGLIYFMKKYKLIIKTLMEVRNLKKKKLERGQRVSLLREKSSQK